MATESSHRSGRAANGDHSARRGASQRLFGWTHRCRRPCHGAGRILPDREVAPSHACPPLDSRDQPFPARHGRRPGSRSSQSRIRSTTRRLRQNLHLPAATCRTASAALTTRRLDRASDLLQRDATQLLASSDRSTQFRGLHSANQPTFDRAHADRCPTRDSRIRQCLAHPCDRAIVPASPSQTNGRRADRSRSRASDRRFLPTTTHQPQTWRSRSHSARRGTHPRQRAIQPTAVHFAFQRTSSQTTTLVNSQYEPTRNTGRPQ